MSRDKFRYLLGLSYIIAVAIIWVVASYIVQSVVNDGVSPFIVTYICNSLFLLYIPIVEIAQFFNLLNPQMHSLENLNLLHETNHNFDPSLDLFEEDEASQQLDEKNQWTRFRVARISLLICPLWFFGQLTFNLSLKYTTVTSNTVLSSVSGLLTFLVSLAFLGERFTWFKLVSVLLCMGGTIISNTILSSASSLFTFLVSLAFLGEKFTWLKLVSVLLCMGGTIIVSLADSSSDSNAVATNPVLGDILAIISASLYAVYISMIRAKLPDEDDGNVQASTAQFLGYLGLFNFVIFLPVVFVLDFTKLEAFHLLTLKQFGLIVGKGLIDNVVSDYLQVKATQLTSTTVATAGLSIQVPLAAVADSLTGHAPSLIECIGATSIMVGFVGINIPSNDSIHSHDTMQELEAETGSLELRATSVA